MSPRRPPATLKAYKRWLRGLECWQQETSNSDEEAHGFLGLVLETAPYCRFM